MTNQAAIGYAVLAAKELGYSEEKVKQLAGAIHSLMDVKTEGQAEKAYANIS